MGRLAAGVLGALGARAIVAVAFVAGVLVAGAVVVGGGGAAGTAGAAESALRDEDRRAFAWFDGIGVPSCAGRPYVRVTWVRKDPPADAPPAARRWELDGFLLAEGAERRTILDADQIARKVERAPREWTASVAKIDLAPVAAAAAARLRARVSDPGAVEPVEQVFRGVRGLLGDEALALALARHCAANRLEAEARELLEAARALPQTPPAAGAALETVAASQMHEPLLRRILADFHDLEIPRRDLLDRTRKWRTSFPESPHAARAAEIAAALTPLAEEDARTTARSAADLAKLAPAARAKVLVARLRDQTGDVRVDRSGRASLDLAEGPVDAVVAAGHDAVPALLDALTDARWTRTVLFRLDDSLDLQFVARVGDVADAALRRVSGKSFREARGEAPSMFQDGTAAEVARRWREWWDAAGVLAPRIAAIAAETDPARRASLARSFPDRGTGPLAGAADAVWGARSFVGAVPGLTPEAARTVLRTLVADAPRPRTRALAAWALLDLGDEGAVGSVAALWRAMDDGARADPEQGGAVVSFLAACGRPEAIAALADGLGDRPPGVRELVVLAFAERGLGAVRGFAADRPDGIPEKWTLAGPAADAAEDLVAARLEDLAEDPLGRIPRQVPLCDLDRDYDCGRRIADAAVRVLGRRWPSRYALRDAPVRSAREWESHRTAFLDAWHEARAARTK